jgi:hypothetical protein
LPSNLDWWSDSDEEAEGPDWVVRTKQQIADAQPHDDDFWNCWHCKKQVLGPTFVSYPANEEKKAPAVRVHIFECALTFRKEYNMVWDWELAPGVPKEGMIFWARFSIHDLRWIVLRHCYVIGCYSAVRLFRGIF